MASRPASCWAFMSFRRLIEVLTVLKLVSMPPSQRWSTKGTPARLASVATVSRAWRLVPTIRMVPRLADSCLANLVASWNIGSDFSRLMMWILLRWPKMNGAILGFQKRVWWPKWTPASSISRMDDGHGNLRRLGLKSSPKSLPPVKMQRHLGGLDSRFVLLSTAAHCAHHAARADPAKPKDYSTHPADRPCAPTSTPPANACAGQTSAADELDRAIAAAASPACAHAFLSDPFRRTRVARPAGAGRRASRWPGWPCRSRTCSTSPARSPRPARRVLADAPAGHGRQRWPWRAARRRRRRWWAAPT